MDNDVVVVKAYRDTRNKLKLSAALNAKSMQDYLTDLVERDYKEVIKKVQKK